jgi:hypothetical protein
LVFAAGANLSANSKCGHFLTFSYDYCRGHRPSRNLL